ncbi:MAG: DUF4442 domain-containing protein [Proteobacteria bacterium]|nr:MAG: DUF4442 domain-containing protein [Pseudomonadota bacterium]
MTPIHKPFKAWLFKTLVNLAPCIRGGRGRVIRISPDFRRLTVRLRLWLGSRNIVGTIYGGSMYASTDPFYMLMLMQILGDDFVVWDKGCTIRFRRPAKKTIYADFEITQAMLDEVLVKDEQEGETSFTWPLSFKDKNGVTYSEFDKVLYVAKKSFYKEKLAKRRA